MKGMIEEQMGGWVGGWVGYLAGQGGDGGVVDVAEEVLHPHLFRLQGAHRGRDVFEGTLDFLAVL